MEKQRQSTIKNNKQENDMHDINKVIPIQTKNEGAEYFTQVPNSLMADVRNKKVTT